MKVMTVLGTRPEIIRLSRIIPELDRHCDHVLVHTGQNYDPNLNEIFFRDLGVREPDHYLGIEGRSFGDQIGRIISRTEEVMAVEKPDRLLILGDTNSGLAAVVAKRMGIPVFHMEAGNRCYDDRVPEEVNRRIIDHSSDILMPYTERSRANLLREGIAGHHIFVTGNPIYEVIQHYRTKVEESDILDRLGIAAGAYFLVTVHRAENVDDEGRLRSILRCSPGDIPAVPTADHLQPPPPNEGPDGADGSLHRHGGHPVPRAVRILRLRPTRAACGLRAQRQRNRPGGVLHLPGAERHDSGRDRATRDDRVRQQHPERCRSRASILDCVHYLLSQQSPGGWHLRQST